MKLFSLKLNILIKVEIIFYRFTYEIDKNAETYCEYY